MTMLEGRPSKGGSSVRANPAHRARGSPLDLGDDRARGGTIVPARVVNVAPSPPGSGQALPRRATGSAAGRSTDQTEAPCDNSDRRRRRTADHQAYRGRLGVCAAAVAATEAALWATQARSPHGACRDPLGLGQWVFVERPSGRGVWSLADDLWPLPQMA